MRIALVVDNPFRDLPGLVLVASMLARAGATCHLVPMMREDLELRALAPDGVLLNYLRPTNAELVRQLLEAEVSVSVLDTEGPQLGDLPFFDRTLPDDRALHRGVTTYFSWGRKLAEHCLASGWFSDGQMLVSGHPRFDLYTSKWRDAVLDASPFAKSVGDRMVLVTTSFPLANPQFASANLERSMLIRNFRADPTAVTRWHERQRSAMNGMVDAIRQLAPALPEANFVVRPHPFERIEAYRSTFDGFPNVRVDRQGGIEGWILRARAVIQRGSTTAIEASIAGVPAFSPDWLARTDPGETVTIPSVHCGTPAELETAVRQAVTTGFAPSEEVTGALRRIIEDWFHQPDGLASERIAEALLERTPVETRATHVRRCQVIGSSPPGRTAASPSVVAATRRWAKAWAPPTLVGYLRGRNTSLARPSQKHFDDETVRSLVSSFGRSDPSLGIGALDVRPARAAGQYARHLPHPGSVTLRARSDA